MNIKEAIKEKTVIHCETESEANRILKMAHELGYNWGSGKSFTAQNNWEIYEKATCYYIKEGSYSDIKYFTAQNNWEIYEKATCYYIKEGSYGDIKHFKDANYSIINSIDITGMKQSTDWTPAPEDLLVMNNELTITLPSGYEIDEEKTTFQKLVFRKIEKKLPTELSEIDRLWYIDDFGYINESSEVWPQTPNNFTSKESAEEALKFIKLLAFRDAIWEIEGEPENTDIDISFNFKTPEGAEHFKKMRREIELGNL